MNRVSCLACVTVAAVCWTTGPAISAQGESRPQAEVASKNVKFEVIAPIFRGYREAKAATDLEAARKAVGQPASFKGTVIEVFAPSENTMVVLHFAKEPKTALRAVVRQENFFRFPKLEDLKGKTVMVTAKVTDSAEGPEMVLIRPGQLKVLK